MELTVGKEKIEFNQEKNALNVVLNANQVTSLTADMIEQLLVSNATLLSGNVTNADGQTRFTYALPKGAVNLSQATSKLSTIDRLTLAQKAVKLGDWHLGDLIPVLHPQNLFIVAGDIKIAHRGWQNLWAPKSDEGVADLHVLQALAASIVNARLSFEDALGDVAVVRDAFTKSVLSTTTIAELRDVIDQQLQLAINEQKISKAVVSKRTYQTFKFGFLTFVVLTALAGGFAGYQSMVVVPKRDRVITSQSAYMSNDYDKTTKTLANDKADSLPKAAQYVLAASYVHLDTLTNQQKENVLNNLSTKTETNILLYWINLGRGDFNDALSLAKNVGDDQLILHAYTKLYDATQANTKMSGGKKQELLSTYKEQIDKYVKKLGGSADGVEK